MSATVGTRGSINASENHTQYYIGA